MSSCSDLDDDASVSQPKALMRLRGILLVSLVAAHVTTANDAIADHRKIVLFGDPALIHAVEVGLEPWDVDVVGGRADPGATMPHAADEAGSTAAVEHANGVVWISTDANGETALWVYDADEKRVTSRALRKTPPFDDATAAAIALSVKTLLRLTSIAPPAERFGSVPAATPVTEITPPPPSSAAPPRPAPEPSHPIAIEITGGARFAQTDAAIAEARATIGGFYSFGRISLGVETSLGPGIAVDSAAFHARETDATFAAHARYRWPIGRFLVMPELGPSGHVELLDGAYASGGVHTLRFDPALDAGATWAWSLSSRAYVGVHASASWLLRWQRFDVDGARVLGGSPILADVGLRLGVELP